MSLYMSSSSSSTPYEAPPAPHFFTGGCTVADDGATSSLVLRKRPLTPPSGFGSTVDGRLSAWTIALSVPTARHSPFWLMAKVVHMPLPVRSRLYVWSRPPSPSASAKHSMPTGPPPRTSRSFTLMSFVSCDCGCTRATGAVGWRMSKSLTVWPLRTTTCVSLLTSFASCTRPSLRIRVIGPKVRGSRRTTSPAEEPVSRYDSDDTMHVLGTGSAVMTPMLSQDVS
mmetsp:Transcript_37907/g.117141  ORF Transcript_37907/g.117141 Transcript_37907/m.117141 type:complete len:226 (+) Transcript_37907:1273-1950(+)